MLVLCRPSLGALRRVADISWCDPAAVRESMRTSAGYLSEDAAILLLVSLPAQCPHLPPVQLERPALSPEAALPRFAWTHAHETLIWASRSRSSRHTFNYDLINSPDPTGQVSSVWRIPTVSRREKLHGYHPTQKPLRLVRPALLVSSRESDLVFDSFCGSRTTAVAARELNRSFVGAELEEEFAKLVARRVAATKRGSMLREIAEQFWAGS